MKAVKLALEDKNKHDSHSVTEQKIKLNTKITMKMKHKNVHF